MKNSSQAESYCVDGDIKFIAGDIVKASFSYLKAYRQNPGKTKAHIEGLPNDQIREVVDVFEDWLKPRQESKYPKLEATPDQVWAFIFCLDPESIDKCFASIEPLLQKGRYEQVINSCTAILQQNSLVDITSLLLFRGLARTLSTSQTREAISDYLRAFLKNKDVVIKIVQEKQKDFLPNIQSAMEECVYSECPQSTDIKAYKQWLALTVDCCRFLLAFSSKNFNVQMTYAERLQAMHKIERAISTLSEVLESLRQDLPEDPEKISETLLRRASCFFAKQHVDKAIDDLRIGLITISESKIKIANRENINWAAEVNLLMAENTIALKIAKKIFDGKPIDFSELYPILANAASKITQESRFKTVTKVEHVRAMSELYRAMLIIQPNCKEDLFKLANCYAKMGKHKHAVSIFNKLLSEDNYGYETATLSARAACYKELGNKELALKDYDNLLRQNPRDEILLCERAMVNMYDSDISSLVKDLLAAYKINPKSVVTHINKEPLLQRTKTRQILFEYAKTLLHEASLPSRKIPRPDDPNVNEILSKEDPTTSSALSISHLLVHLNPADQSSHILMAHAMFHAGCINDAETKLKKMLTANYQAVDNHVIKLHLGLIKIFTTRLKDGMETLIEVLKQKGEQTISSLLRDIPISERARLSDDSHQYGIDQLQKNRDQATVQNAIKCFTLAILCCRETDLVLEESPPPVWLLLTDSKCLVGISRKDTNKMTHSAWSLASVTLKISKINTSELKITFPLQNLGRRLNGGTGVYRSYLARAECMAHLGDQRKAILDFSAAIEVNPLCVEGLCGRSFMRLALGDETECINDVTTASELDMYTVVTHIHALPDEAKRLMLFWLDHRVVALLLNYGYRGNLERIDTGGSASTISVMDETALKPDTGEISSSSLSSINPLSSNSLQTYAEELTNGQQTTKNVKLTDKDFVISNVNAVALVQHQLNPDNSATSLTVNTNVNNEGSKTQIDEELLRPGTNSDELKESVTSLNSQYSARLEPKQSRGSVTSTMTSYSNCNDPISSMDKLEILQKALLLGKLLISVEPSNSTWQGMYADILIVKGDYDEALLHLQVVMDMNPSDVTAIARAGLINVKMNRYISSCRLLSSLCTTDRGGLVYVLKAIDSSRKRKLAEESLKHAESFIHESKHMEARDYYTLSLMADSYMRIDKLRKRARCLTRLGEPSKALVDMNEVIKENKKDCHFNDYCTRGAIYLLVSKESEACRDYMKAIELDRNQAIAGIHVKPGRGTLCRVFYREAFEAFSKKKYQACHDICEAALLIDDNNINMRKLRARAKREITKCTIQ